MCIVCEERYNTTLPLVLCYHHLDLLIMFTLSSYPDRDLVQCRWINLPVEILVINHTQAQIAVYVSYMVTPSCVYFARTRALCMTHILIQAAVITCRGEKKSLVLYHLQTRRTFSLCLIMDADIGTYIRGENLPRILVKNNLSITFQKQAFLFRVRE